MDSSTSYEYKAGVRDKVKEIESRLLVRGGQSEDEETIETDQFSFKDIPKEQPENILLHLNQQAKPQIKPNELEKEAVPPVPLPRKATPAPVRPQTLSIQPVNENVVLVEREMSTTPPPLSSNDSTTSTRRSSEDDGFADMASESDAFDDSTMPLPKIKDNAFYIKDRRRSNENCTGESVMDGHGVRSNYQLSPSPPQSLRRGSLNPQSDMPKLQRTRTDSTNSAENYFVQQISSDMNRRESEAEVKFDLLQSKGSNQISSPVGSPVIVRSKTLSHSTASILILGLPQSGKSSTINSLVKAHVASKNESTAEIVEYTAKIKILDSSSLFNLKIIETPGYTNDPTISFDARLMSTLLSYMESKDGLRSKHPTVVLVVLRFDDKRLWNPEDEHPDIVNFLKIFNNFQSNLNDGKYANFVFVLTHFFSEYTTEQELKRPQSKMVELINLIQKYTSLPHPIMVVCAENESRSWRKDKSSSGGTDSRKNSLVANEHSFTVTFPNGETFPYNLIERIKILLTRKGRDSVGETVLRTAFGIEYPYSIKECKITQRIPLFPLSHLAIQPMQKTLVHAYLDIERTEIFTLLEIGWENIEKRVRETYPDSLFTVQQIFQTKKVRKFEDIPEDPIKVLNLVRQMPSNLAVKDLLTETLQLKVPAYYPALFIGQGFDLCKDATTTVSPFQFSSELKTSPVGLIPNELDCKIRDDREICFKFFYEVEEYISERMKDLNLRYAISPNSLTALSSASASSGQHRWGYNMIRKNQEPTKSTLATAIIEYRIFQLNLQQQSNLQFKPQFWDTVEELPDLDIKDAQSVSAWKDFFGYWGTHVVKSAFGGGSVEITFKGQVLNKIFNSMKKDFVLPSDEYDTTRVFQWITGDGLDFVASCGKDLKSEFIQGYDVQAHFHGGDIKFQSVDLTKLESKDRVAELREEWKESLVSNPVILETNLILVPLSYFVREKSEGIATKIDVALHYFYSDFMVTQGKQSSCTIL